MATINLNQNRPAPGVHEGINQLIADVSISASGTTSAGDLLIIGRIPHGAIVTDAVLYAGAAVNGTSVCGFGTSASPSAFLTTATYSLATYRYIKTTTPIAVSLSDDAMPRYENVICGTSTILTAGLHYRLVVSYKMPPA